MENLVQSGDFIDGNLADVPLFCMSAVGYAWWRSLGQGWRFDHVTRSWFVSKLPSQIPVDSIGKVIE